MATLNGRYSFQDSDQFHHLSKLLKYNIEPSQLDHLLENYIEESEYPPSKIKQDEHVVYDFDFIIENQRGMKVFGIPLFSNKSLLPFIDPSNYQHINGKTILLNYNKIENYPLPDLAWKWGWSNWYIYMVHDVDDQGWIYSSLIFNWKFNWKGKYYFGNFIRRRIWIRLRYEVHHI